MRLIKNIFCKKTLFFIKGRALTAALLLFSPCTYAVNWLITPHLTVSETYIDNVRLAGAVLGRTGGSGGGGAAGAGAGGIGLGGFGGVRGSKSDFITQINPGFTVLADGRRLNLSANYTMNNLIFAQNTNLTRIRHLVNAQATTELVRDVFFVDGTAIRRQQNILFDEQATSSIGNRASLQIYTVSPYLRHSFGNFASTELRYTHGIVNNALRDSVRDGYQFNMNSGDNFRKVAWGLNASQQKIKIDGLSNQFLNQSSQQNSPTSQTFRDTITLRRAIGNVRYLLNPRFSLTASGGYEDNKFIRSTRDISSPTWTVGFIWAPSRRTDVTFSTGRRFFGDTYSGEINHRRRLTTWTARYTEQVTTFNQQAGQNSASNLVGGLLGQNVNGPALFLQKRFQASVTVNGARNTLTLNVFDLLRKSLTEQIDTSGLTDQQAIDEGLAATRFNTKQTGGNAIWRYTISRATTAAVNLNYVRVKFLGSDRITDNMIFSADLTKEFQPNLTGVLQYSRIQRRVTNGNDLSANAVTVSLNMSF